VLGQDAPAGDRRQDLGCGREDALGSGTDLLPEGGQGFLPPLVVRQVGDVLPQDQFPGVGDGRRLDPAVKCLPTNEDLR
jgi:hypothetical protein